MQRRQQQQQHKQPRKLAAACTILGGFSTLQYCARQVACEAAHHAAKCKPLVHSSGSPGKWQRYCMQSCKTMTFKVLPDHFADAEQEVWLPVWFAITWLLGQQVQHKKHNCVKLKKMVMK